MVFLHIMNSFCAGVSCKRCSYSTQLGRAEKVSLSRADGRLPHEHSTDTAFPGAELGQVC